MSDKVNEYEGQHRLAGQDPEVPVSRRVNEYEGQHRLAGQDPEMPVSPNLAAGADSSVKPPKVVVEGE